MSELGEVYPRDIPVIRGFNQLMLGAPHEVARTKINSKLLEMAEVELGITDLYRVPVPESAVSWNVNLPGYGPRYIDLPRGNTRYKKPDDYPDPADPTVVPSFFSLEGTVELDYYGRPVNPVGRTGLAGRGMLNKWGATQAADTVLTRISPVNGGVEVLLVIRSDTGEIAVPGGKLNPGEAARDAAKREMYEEAGISGVDLDMWQARLIYAGYVDDSRNTDNAWMETSVFHAHLTDGDAEAVTIEAGDDAADVKWIPYVDQLYKEMFASHGQYLRAIMKEWP